MYKSAFLYYTQKIKKKRKKNREQISKDEISTFIFFHVHRKWQWSVLGKRQGMAVGCYTRLDFVLQKYTIHFENKRCSLSLIANNFLGFPFVF